MMARPDPRRLVRRLGHGLLLVAPLPLAIALTAAGVWPLASLAGKYPLAYTIIVGGAAGALLVAALWRAARRAARWAARRGTRSPDRRDIHPDSAASPPGPGR